MKRKAIAMAMAMMMIASAASVCSAASVTDFKDVPSTSWYYTSVKGAVDDGYMNGVSKDAFAPSNNLTRAMFATILARYDKATVDNTATSAFADVEANKWYTGSVVWGSKNGIINGYSATKFGTNDFIKREDLALMVYRYVNFKNYTLKEKTPVTFKDADQISAYAKEALEYCRTHGLFIGDQNGYLHPQKLITRAEAAAVMERIDLVIKENTGGGSSGGNGGGSSYDYVDYQVKAEISSNKVRDGKPVDFYAYGSGTDKDWYHVILKDGKYVNHTTNSNSEDISLEQVAKDACDVDNIVVFVNALKKVEINGQKLISDDGSVNDIKLTDENGDEYTVNVIESLQDKYPKTASEFVDKYVSPNQYISQDEIDKLKTDPTVEEIRSMLQPTNWVENGKLKDNTTYASKAEDLVSKLESLREKYVKGKDATRIKNALDSILEKASKESILTYSIGDTEKLAEILVMDDPTLIDLEKAGLTEFTASVNIADKDVAMSYIDRLLNKSGKTMNADLKDKIAEKAVGTYSAKISITKKDCNNSATH